MVAKPDRPTVCLDGQLAAAEPSCLCSACAGRAGATHTHALLSRRATGNISSIPENEAAAAAAEASAAAPGGRACEGHCGRACVVGRAGRGVSQTLGGGGPVCLDALRTQQTTRVRQNTIPRTTRPRCLVYRHRRPAGRKIAFATEQHYVL